MYAGRPVWAEIDLSAIKHNFREVRRLVGPNVQVMAIVKANAYGHGATAVAASLAAEGADCFGVALLNEAVELREAGISQPIMILGWTPQEDFQRALDLDITLSIFSLEEARQLSRISQDTGKKACVHLKVDTGMGRLGFRPDETDIEKVCRLLDLPGLAVKGIFTHLAKADERDKTYTSKQLTLFQDFVASVSQKSGFTFPVRHVANSAAVIDHPEAYLEMVRPGIMLYGLKPSDAVKMERVELRQAFTLRARIAQVKEVPAGVAVSYGGCYVTEERTVIATLPLGYADGYSRLLSGRTAVLLHGQRYHQIGRVCMDQFMVNLGLTQKPVQQGDVVTLIGRDGSGFISVDEIADILGTINYEVTCMISGRVPRVFSHF